MAATNTVPTPITPMAAAAAAQPSSQIPAGPRGPVQRALGMAATALALNASATAWVDRPAASVPMIAP